MRSERLTALSGYIRQQRYCRMGDLAEHFHISLATIHRDVQELVVMGHVHKVHGGVVSLLAASVELRQPRPQCSCKRRRPCRPPSDRRSRQKAYTRCRSCR